MKPIHVMSRLARKFVLSLLLIGLGGGFAFTPDATAQRWLQTTQLLVPIESEAPTQALLDTLINVVERRDDMMLRRSPDDREKVNLSDLRDKLIDESGVGLRSASHIFIDYRFEIQNQGFQESITGMHFIFRQGEDKEDIPIMYIDANKTWVKDLLRNKGTTLASNEAALQTFGDQLAFARLAETGDITEISGEPVREGYERKKRELTQKIQRLTYESM